MSSFRKSAFGVKPQRIGDIFIGAELRRNVEVAFFQNPQFRIIFLQHFHHFQIGDIGAAMVPVRTGFVKQNMILFGFSNALIG